MNKAIPDIHPVRFSMKAANLLTHPSLWTFPVTLSLHDAGIGSRFLW